MNIPPIYVEKSVFVFQRKEQVTSGLYIFFHTCLQLSSFCTNSTNNLLTESQNSSVKIWDEILPPKTFDLGTI